MLMALTAVAVMACRVRPSWQVTTATALARRRKASFVWAASGSSGEVVGITFTPERFFFVDAVPYCTLHRTVRYSKNSVGRNRKVLRLNLHGAPARKSYADSRR